MQTVYRGSSSSSSSYSRGPSSSNMSLGQMFMGLLGIAAFFASVAALFAAASTIMAAAPVMLAVLNGTASEAVVTNLVLSAIAGAFAGAAAVAAHAWERKGGKTEQNFISALFNKGLAKQDFGSDFWSRVAIGTSIGLLVGAWLGAAGAISLPQWLGGSGPELIAMLATSPIAIAVGGGFGGAGGGGLGSLLFFLLVVLVLALVLGALTGFLIHLVIYSIAGGVTKGASKAFVVRILDQPASTRKPIREGMVRGAIVGLLTGCVEGLATLASLWSQ